MGTDLKSARAGASLNASTGKIKESRLARAIKTIKKLNYDKIFYFSFNNIIKW